MTTKNPNPKVLAGLPKDPLAENDLAFLQMRRRFLRFWKIAGFSTLVFLSALFFWLFFKVPNLVNPFHVQRQIDSNALTPTALKVMAVLTPLMVSVAFFLAAAIILFGFSAYANEQRYLKIIDSLLPGKKP
jgi:dolichyl-phosphate-mannose--protein O-mannosyl transferase